MSEFSSRKKENRFRKKGQSGYIRIFGFLKLMNRVLVLAAGLFIISLVLIYLHDVIMQSNYFRADTIDVKGMRRLGEEEIMNLAGVHPGVNLLSVNTKKAGMRLMQNPWIQTADVERDLPGRMIIRIKEHDPLAICVMTKKYLINHEGRIFKEWQKTDPVDLPLVTGLGYADVYLDDQPCSRAFSAVMDILKVGKDPFSILPNRIVKYISVDQEMGLTLFVESEAFGEIKKIDLGFERYPEKFEGLKHVIRYLHEHDQLMNVESVCLYNLERIVVNPLRREFFNDPGTIKSIQDSFEMDEMEVPFQKHSPRL